MNIMEFVNEGVLRIKAMYAQPIRLTEAGGFHYENQL